jgi:ABC-type Zn2+ transport system substrate-binding protein/surface adhesin
MTPPIEKVPTWLVDWSIVTIIDNTLPPRDPNDDDNEDDEDDQDDERHNNESHDEDDEDDEPAVIREPDE